MVVINEVQAGPNQPGTSRDTWAEELRCLRYILELGTFFVV